MSLATVALTSLAYTAYYSVGGFMFGLISAGLFGYIYLMEDYNSAAGLLLGSIEELRDNILKIKEYAKKIEALDSEIKAIQYNSPTNFTLDSMGLEHKKSIVRELY